MSPLASSRPISRCHHSTATPSIFRTSGAIPSGSTSGRRGARRVVTRCPASRGVCESRAGRPHHPRHRGARCTGRCPGVRQRGRRDLPDRPRRAGEGRGSLWRGGVARPILDRPRRGRPRLGLWRATARPIRPVARQDPATQDPATGVTDPTTRAPSAVSRGSRPGGSNGCRLPRRRRDRPRDGVGARRARSARLASPPRSTTGLPEPRHDPSRRP